MSIKDLIGNAFNKDASEFEKVFEDIMSEKTDAALSAKYDEMFESKEDDDKEYEKEEDDEDEEEDDD